MISNKTITFAATSFVTANGLSVQSGLEAKAQAQSLANSQFWDTIYEDMNPTGPFPNEPWNEPQDLPYEDWIDPLPDFVDDWTANPDWMVESDEVWDNWTCGDPEYEFCNNAWDWTDCSG